MRLALEIPKPHLTELSKLTDYDFALAHEVLEDPFYAEFYREQSRAGRRVILDNGMHEKGGKSLTVPEILAAAKLINPTVVIPPDKIGDAKFTYENFHLLRKDPRLSWEPGLVVQGKETSERMRLFNDCIRYTFTLFLPYREPRMLWMQEFVNAIPRHVSWPANLHLLGMNDFTELEWFCNFTRNLNYPPARVFIDTAKPIKWAAKGKQMDELKDVHKGGVLDHTAKLDTQHMCLALYNIALMRKYTA